MKAVDYALKKKTCIYSCPTYNPPFVEHHACLFIKDYRGKMSGYPEAVPFKHPCTKDDWLICPFNNNNAVLNIVKREVSIE